MKRWTGAIAVLFAWTFACVSTSFAARPALEFEIFTSQIGDPSDPQALLQRLSDIADAGFDHIDNGDYQSEAGVRAFAQSMSDPSLRSGGRHLRGILVWHENQDSAGNPCGIVSFNQYPATCADAIRTTLHDPLFSDPTYVVGWMVDDEPRAPIFPLYQQVAAIIDQEFNGTIMPYMNLLPIDAMGSGDNGCAPTPGDWNQTTYSCYEDEYLNPFDTGPLPAPVLSEDQYPFILDNPNGPFYTIFVNLKVTRDRARAHSTPSYRVPFWQWIQLSPYYADGGFKATPTMPQIRFHAHAALAYGATGIGYWSACPHHGVDGDVYAAGLLNDDGSKTDKYVPVQQFNGELHRLGAILITLDLQATWHQAPMGQVGLDNDLMSTGGATDPLIASFTGVVPGTSTAANEGMVARFGKAATGDDYLFVVNKNTTAARTYTIGLRNHPLVLKQIRKSDGAEIDYPYDAETETFTISSLAAGDAQLFRIHTLTTPLEWLATYHTWGTDQDRTLGGAGQIYDIVASMTAAGGWNDGGVVYFKDRATKQDYVQVGAESPFARTFTVTLATTPTTLQKVDASGAFTDYPHADAQFTVSLQAYERALFKVADGFSEHVRGIKAIRVPTAGTLIAHQSGLLLIPLTGARVHAKDGTAYTPAIDARISGTEVFVLQNNGSGGNVGKRDLNNLAASAQTIRFDNGLPSCIALSSGYMLVGYTRPATGGTYVTVLTRGSGQNWPVYSTVKTTDINEPVIDLEWLSSIKFVLLTGTKVQLFTLSTRAGTPCSKGTSKTVTSGVDLELGSDNSIFIAQEAGSTGKVIKYTSSLGNPSGWSSPVTTPVRRLALNSDGKRMLAAGPSGTQTTFTWFDPANGTVAQSLTISGAPAACRVAGPTDGYLGTSVGLWRNTFAAAKAVAIGPVAMDARANMRLDFTASPNPARSWVRVTLAMPARGAASLALFDVQGRRVRSLFEGSLEPGVHVTRVDLRGLAEGIYFYRLEAGGRVITRKVLLAE